MNGLSVVILSKDWKNLLPCVTAIASCENVMKVVVVDDGLEETGFHSNSCEYELGAALDGATLVKGQKPFIFSRNANLGIVAAGDDDVILLNDDALLKTQGGFTAMQKAYYEGTDRPYGLIGSTCNNVGNRNQWPRSIVIPTLRWEPRMVCFVCVFIPRATINDVGLLDERFVGYGFEDDDYCLRVRQKGLHIGIFDGCYVDHGSLKSSFRGGPSTGGSLAQNAQVFRNKWGASNHEL